MLQDSGIIRLHVSGTAFQEGKSNLSSVVNILSGYERSFQYCVDLASYRLSQKGEPPVKAHLALQSTRPGTLTAETIIDSLPAFVPMIPQIIEYGWNVYQKAQELIKVATMFFNKYERPVPMHIENSPGAMALNIQAQGNIIITSDVLNAAIASHKELGRIAKEVGNKNADRVTIESNSKPDAMIDINRDNHKLFDLPKKHIIDEEPKEIECGIYSFNKYSMNGRLEYMEGETSRLIPFSVEGGNAFDYAAGLTADRSTVTATSEMKLNALGETKVVKFHLLGIKNHRESSQNNIL